MKILFTCRPISVCSFQELHLVWETSRLYESLYLSHLFRKMNTHQEKDALSLDQTSQRAATESHRLSTISPISFSTSVPNSEADGIVAKTLDVFNTSFFSIRKVAVSKKDLTGESDSIITSSQVEEIRACVSCKPTVLSSMNSTDTNVQDNKNHSPKSISSQTRQSSRRSVSKSSIGSSSTSKKIKKTKRRSSFSGGRDTKDRERIKARRKVVDSSFTDTDPYEVLWRRASECNSS